ncbi:CBS domain-containing protein [Actinoallomurus iriomotensis]|uniref:CBS domain-containing protein n=1 Tax=Actinoallomurus iriomotensis TaxID=478107 RepID=A0A9W6W2V7_9ACTN|nr:CBS domain-containing protein [Actinoallomurus iriomotensis]GLY88267.1 hypothetical protein Airi02_061960 [Actinoallomurus iriomotensis]
MNAGSARHEGGDRDDRTRDHDRWDRDLAQGEAVTIGADDDAHEILRTMSDHEVRRLPVIDGHTLIGMVAQADVARTLPDPQVGELVQALSTD